MKWMEQAKLLLDKAAQDEFVADKLLADPDSPVEAIGFSLQQAAEKIIKAALSFREIPYPRTHDLGLLIGLLQDNKVKVPSEFEDFGELSPFAVELRYTLVPGQFGAVGELDLKEARELIRKLRKWVEEMDK